MNNINIWNDKDPVYTDFENFTPYMTFHKAQNPINKCVLVCPGGGYVHLAEDHEGQKIADFFNSFGVDTFILRYTTKQRNNDQYVYPKPFLEATRAVRYIRANCNKFSVNPDCLGIMGFSAGGHLAAWVSTKWDENLFENDVKDDLFGKISARPDFSVLIYPVIDIYKKTNFYVTGVNLLGDNISDETKEKYCLQNFVTENTPKAFIYHTYEDKTVPLTNGLSYYENMIKFNVPGEFHVYEPGVHGLGLVKDLDFVKKQYSNDYEYLKDWGLQLKNWIINKA